MLEGWCKRGSSLELLLIYSWTTFDGRCWDTGALCWIDGAACRAVAVAVAVVVVVVVVVVVAVYF